MPKKQTEITITQEVIINKIYSIRGQKVMLDSDLAELYQVETKQLKRQVRRNTERFPKDFMFEMTKDEFDNLRSQIGTSNWGGTRYMPMVFTEQGISMLSSVLNSDVAIKVNIQIIRIFTKMREILLSHKDILVELEAIKQKLGTNSNDIERIFNYLKQLKQAKQQEIEHQKREKIGFKTNKNDK
jgi:ORF6N domain-containing protein